MLCGRKGKIQKMKKLSMFQLSESIQILLVLLLLLLLNHNHHHNNNVQAFSVSMSNSSLQQNNSNEKQKKRGKNSRRDRDAAKKQEFKNNEKFASTNIPKLLHCEPEAGIGPKYLGRLDLSSKAGSSVVGDDESRVCVYAYLIDKPAGWSIFTSKKKSNKKNRSFKEEDEEEISGQSDEIGESVDFEIDDEMLLKLMTPEEREEFTKDKQKQAEKMSESSIVAGNFERPSVMSWLKDHLSSMSSDSIRAGPKHWKALAGAVDLDDSGVVLLVPKASVSDILVEQIGFMAVVGNGKHLTKSKRIAQRAAGIAENQDVDIKTIKTLDRSRREDIAVIVSIDGFDSPMICSTILDPIQNQFEDGIRGDPFSAPLDRRAQRRLIHCESIQVSSLLQDDWIESKSTLPADFEILLNKNNEDPYGGRSCFHENLEITNVFREINGAADGYPGWTVDRYDRWLFIKHDTDTPFGPIPELYEGTTDGIYIYDSLRDRSMTGPLPKPKLHSGNPAPENLVVVENGVKYVVNLGDQFSTVS